MADVSELTGDGVGDMFSGGESLKVKKKISIIERVEHRRRQEKSRPSTLITIDKDFKMEDVEESRFPNSIILRRLDKSNKKFEIVE